MNVGILIVLLVVSVIVQSVISTIPMALGFFMVTYILHRKTWVFLLAFCAGLVIDILMINHAGVSSLFFIGVLILVSLYERKFEIRTREFVGLSAFCGGIAYLFVTEGTVLITQSIIGAVLSLIVFEISERMSKKKEDD